MELIHGISRFFAIYTNQTLSAAFVLTCLLFVLFEYSKTTKAVLKSQQLFWIVATLGIFVSLTYFFGAVLDLFYPNYIDHFEATVAEISWLGIHGNPIYPDWRTEDIYEAPYGPMLFIINGTVLRIVPTILGSKLAGWAAFVLALALSYIAFKSRTSSQKLAFLFFCIVVVQFSFFRAHVYSYAFWSRAEPFLVLIGVLTLIATLKLPNPAAAITIGIMAGLAVGFKIHGALYALPAFLAICGSGESWRDRIGLAMLSLIAAVVVAGIPFLAWSGASVEGYKSVLLMIGKHGLSLDLFKTNSLFALVLLSPIAFVLYFRRPLPDIAHRWFIAGVFASLAVTTVIASKEGAGPHHLLPFIPLSAYGLLLVWESQSSKPAVPKLTHAVGILVLVPLLVFYSPGAMLWTRGFASRYWATLETEKQKIQELEALYAQYPLAEFGLSDLAHYDDTLYRTLLVFRGERVRIDFASWMDLQFAGISEMRIIHWLDQCDVQVWIIPQGDPFAMINPYTNRPLLSSEFRRTFFANYSVVHEGAYYRVWGCRASGEASQAQFSHGVSLSHE